MSGEFTELDDWLKALLLRVTPAQVRAVNRRVAYALRRGQRDRIARQRNPDGSAYKPRKPQSKHLRSKAGGIRRKTMFAKLRTQSHLKVEATAEELAVGFRGRSATIATAHHHGSIRTSSSGRRYVTPQRQLLGLTDAELDQLADAYLEHLSGQQ